MNGFQNMLLAYNIKNIRTQEAVLTLSFSGFQGVT